MAEAAPPAGGDHGYHDRVNPDLLRLLPAGARLIVECGCGTGALGAAYLRDHTDATYVGIERDTAAGLRARKRLAQVEIGDAEQLDLRSIGIDRGTVDCLVYGDVLEHLIDPWRLVARHAEFLSPSGVVLACIPNVQHWTVLLNLLAGQWRYASEGLLDRTHLRWFTRESVVELFRSAGLTIAGLHRRMLADNRFDVFLDAMTPALAELQIDRARFADDARTLQYVVVAKRDAARPVAPAPEPPPAPRDRRLFLHHVITYAGTVAALTHHRIQAPAAALAERPGVACCIERFTNVRRVSAAAGDRILILQRAALIRPDSIAALRQFLRQDYLVVMDFDDHPNYNPLVAANDYLSFRGVHAVQVTSEPLAALVRQWNPEVAVFPSTIAELGPFSPRSDKAEVEICFAAFNREADWAPLIAALNRTMASLTTPVHLTVVFDRAFFDALTTGRKSYKPLLAYEDYLDVLRGADIVLMPLEDGEFNRCKSDLKFLEAAACGAVALAARGSVYSAIRDGQNGMLFSTAEEFAAALERLVADAGLRRRLAQEAHRYVAEERRLEGQLAAREAWYRSLVARRPELNAALLARVPEYA